MKKTLVVAVMATFVGCYTTPPMFGNVYVSRNIKEVDVCGVVIDQQRSPILGAHVWLTAVNGHQEEAITDATGHFRVEGFSDVQVRIQSIIPEFKDAEAIVGRVNSPGKNYKRPIFIVMAVGGDYSSLVTNKKIDLPKVKNK